MREVRLRLECAKCDWPLAHRELSLALARASSRRYANEHRYHSITNAKVGGCESAALLGVRSAAHTCHGVRCMPRRMMPKSLLPCSASTDEDVLLVGGRGSSPFLSEREHGLTPATSAPGPALPLASLQRDRALSDAGGIIRVGSGSPDGQGPSHASTIGREAAHALRTAELAAAPSPSRPVVPAAVAEADTDADAEVSRERLTRCSRWCGRGTVAVAFLVRLSGRLVIVVVGLLPHGRRSASHRRAQLGTVHHRACAHRSGGRARSAINAATRSHW